MLRLMSFFVGWKGTLVIALLVAAGGAVGFFYIQSLRSGLELARLERDHARERVAQVEAINQSNADEFKRYDALMQQYLEMLKQEADAERLRNEELTDFLEDLQNVEDTDLCSKSEPVRRALEWLRNRTGPEPN